MYLYLALGMMLNASFPSFVGGQIYHLTSYDLACLETSTALPGLRYPQAEF